MAREISPVFDFTFQIHMYELTDRHCRCRIDDQGSSRYLYHIEGIIWLNPWYFHHGAGLCSLFPHYKGRLRPSKMRVDKQQHGTITKQCPDSLPLLSKSVIPENVLQVRAGLGGLTKSIGLIQ